MRRDDERGGNATETSFVNDDDDDDDDDDRPDVSMLAQLVRFAPSSVRGTIKQHSPEREENITARGVRFFQSINHISLVLEQL